MTRIGVGNVTQRTRRWFASDSVMMHEGIEKLRELDRLFGQAERYTRRGEYTEAIQAYRTFARQAEDYLETFEFSEHTEECPFCGQPLEQNLNSEPREKRAYCSECRESLQTFTHITAVDLAHFQRLAIETAQNLREGEHGLDWTTKPPEEHPHFATERPVEVDHQAREVVLRLVTLQQELGHRPTPLDADQSSILDPSYVFACFGSWENALEAAGLV